MVKFGASQSFLNMCTVDSVNFLVSCPPNSIAYQFRSAQMHADLLVENPTRNRLHAQVPWYSGIWIWRLCDFTGPLYIIMYIVCTMCWEYRIYSNRSRIPIEACLHYKPGSFPIVKKYKPISTMLKCTLLEA